MAGVNFGRRVMTRAAWRWLLLAPLFVALAGPAVSADKPTILRVVPQSDLRVLDPYVTSATITRIHGMMIYDTLFGWDAAMTAQPQMVGAYQISADRLTYDFTLRDGLRFHDGAPVTASDVVASLERAARLDSLLQALGTRGGAFSTTSERSFRLVLKQPFAYVELALGSPGAVIMRAADLTAAGDKPVTSVNGSGPFRFVSAEHVPGARIVYERNPDYVPRAEPASGMAGGKMVKVDRVEWTVMPDLQIRTTALLRGEVDLLDQLPHDAIPLLTGKKGVQLVRTQVLPVWAFMRVNWLSPPFDDVRARQAMALIVDQKDYLSAAFGTDSAWWQECFAFLVCGTSAGSTEGSEPFQKPDLERAKQLLVEAGYKGEPIRILSTQEIPLIGALSEVTADKLRQIGINVSLETSDWGTLGVRRAKMEPGAWHIYHSAIDGVQTSQAVSNPMINSRCDHKNLPGWPCSEAIERLRQGAIDDPSPANYAALSRQLWADLPLIPIGQYIQPMAAREEVSGFVPSALLVFWNIEKR